jgi:ethanolamine utilization protein EutJ
VSKTQVTALLGRAAALLDRAGTDTGADQLPRSARPGQLPTFRVGIDLGTATCVLAVLDPDGQPAYVASYPSGALRDGVVVEFAAAQRTVCTLKQDAERVLGTTLTAAATAYPPCIAEADARACRFVCEAAGFDKVTLTDEVTAAQQVLGIADGVVIDVGGGSTGVGIYRSGERVALADRPGGGHHLDLVLAGALGITTEEAERRKREDPRGALPHLVPGLERIAESIRLMTADAGDLPLHLAGGALMIPGAAEVVARYLGRETVSYPHALLITPLGIAQCSP